MRLEVTGDQERLEAARKNLEALVPDLQHESPGEVTDSQVRRPVLGWYPLRR